MDNTRIKDRSGAAVDIASKDLGSGVQLLKLVFANDSGTPTAMGAGFVDSSVPRVTLASGAKVGVNSTGRAEDVDVTRPANTTPYSAGDVVGGLLTFSYLGDIAGHAFINTVMLRYDVATVPTGMTAFRLHLYSTTPPSAYADNAAWDLPSGDRAAYIGFIDLGGMIDLGSTLFAQVDNVGKQVAFDIMASDLYAYLQTIGAYTPASNSETLRIRINTVGV